MSGAEITVSVVVGVCLLLIVYSRGAGAFLDKFLNAVFDKKQSVKSTNQDNK